MEPGAPVPCPDFGDLDKVILDCQSSADYSLAVEIRQCIYSFSLIQIMDKQSGASWSVELSYISVWSLSSDFTRTLPFILLRYASYSQFLLFLLNNLHSHLLLRYQHTSLYKVRAKIRAL
jgi:hypothetical protein